jgi:hypothetical protein
MTLKPPQMIAPPSLTSLPSVLSNYHHIMPGLIPEFANDKPWPTFINNIDNESITNVFCVGAFANKNTGVVYNNCTRNILLVLLDGNICFFVLHHYKTNTFFATPIPGLDSQSIL